MGSFAVAASAAVAQGSQVQETAGKKTVEILAEYSGKESFFGMPYRLSDMGVSYTIKLNGIFFGDPRLHDKQIEIGFYKKERKPQENTPPNPQTWIYQGNFDAFYIYDIRNGRPSEDPVAGAYIDGKTAIPVRFESDKKNKLVKTPMALPEYSGASYDLYQLVLSVIKGAFSAR